MELENLNSYLSNPSNENLFTQVVFHHLINLFINLNNFN